MTPPSDPPQDDSIVLQRFVGLKNVVGEERLTPQEFSLALDVDLDDAGQVRRRRGSTLVSPGNWHSLFVTNAGKVLGVKNGALGLVNPNYSFTVISPQVGANPALGAQLAYEQVDHTIYFTSPFESGKVDEATLAVSAWGPAQDMWLSPVINPTATLPAIRGRLLGAPPRATDLTYWNGRMYLAQGRLLWATELYAYDLVDKTRNFYQFDADITMTGAVGDGVYVGTTAGLWFLSGTHAEGLKRVPIMDSAVIPGSKVYMPAELANPPQIDLGTDSPVSLALLFMTANGYCAGQNGGQAYNLTESKFVFPDAVRAYAMYRRQDGVHQYVVALDSGGTPAANARFGDHLDATLIRAGSWVDQRERVRFSDSFVAVAA